MGKEKLPTSWVLSNIEKSVKILDNMRKPVNAKERAKRQGNIPYYGATGIAGTIDDYIFNENLVLLGEDGAPFLDRNKNVAYEISGKSWVNNHAHVLKAKPQLTSNRFLLHYLNYFNYEGYVGGTTRLKLNQGSLKSIPFPIPPRAEQDRIVAKLDVLFAQLESINKSLDHIPTLLKNFRQQVLTQAVTGKLTEEWREGKELEEWKLATIGSLFKVQTGSTPKRGTSKYYDNATIPWLKSGQVKNEFIYNAEEFITQKAVDDTNAKVYPIDTLLVAMYGEGKTRGQVGWMKISAASNQAIAALVNEDMKNDLRSYVYHFCLSQYNEIRAQAEGGNQPNLNLTKIKNWQINIPSEKERTKIIDIVESLFAKADAIEAHYQALKTKIEHLPQSILHKAFKGELVPQLDSDGDARELLGEIEDASTALSKTKRVKKKLNKSKISDRAQSKSNAKQKSKNYNRDDGAILGRAAKDEVKYRRK